jgi:hypothetical protein
LGSEGNAQPASGACAMAPSVCEPASVAVIPSTAKAATPIIAPHTDLFMLPPLPLQRRLINPMPQHLLMNRNRRILAQAHLTRPGLTDLDRCPVQNLGTASLPNLNRMRHQGFLNFLLLVTENRQFHKFIIVTIILPVTHEAVIY